MPSAILRGSFGGTIRSAGGAFSRLEAARESEYFFHLQEAQVKELKEHNNGTHEERSNVMDSEKLFRIAAEQRAKLSKMPQVE
uniref:ATPase inhibitor, mitochondrial n=1 Tax=Syphacia muris TaxID=451379 RepID=A0A0N5AHP2_9BILA